MSRAASLSQIIRKPAVTSQKGLLASQNRIASEIGANILTKGGNAIDAAPVQASKLDWQARYRME